LKRYLFIMLVVVYSLLNAVEYHTASSLNVRPSLRDSLVYYHTNNDDQHWFGSDSWAVKFEFNEFYSGIDSLLFEAEGANIFIPGSNGTDPITIKLCEDDYGQPFLDTPLFSQTLQASEIQYQAWNHFQFPNTIIDTTESILWLVADYPTNSSEQFISASAVGGLQSYFLSNGYYYNMYSFSYDSEFLFSLNGRFVTDGTDLDLITVEWEGDLIPGSTIHPKFTIRSNSDVQVTGSYIIPLLEDPSRIIDLIYSADSTYCSQIALPPLNAGETYVIDVSDSLLYNLPNRASQYQFEAELYCETDSLMENNSIEDEFQIFLEQSDKLMIENAVQLDNTNSSSLWNAQVQLLHSNCIFINYFADLYDEPFFNNDSYQRFHYYDLMGFPVTIVCGSEKILGYNSGYLNQFMELYNSFFPSITFINNVRYSAYSYDQGNVNFSYELQNAETLLFDEFINDLTLRIAIIENVMNEPGLPENFNVPVFIYLIVENDVTQFLESNTISDSIQFNLNEDFETISDTTATKDNCEIVFWLQNDVTKEIFYVNKLPFTEFQFGITDLDENEISNNSHTLTIFPNPCRKSELMNISFSLPNIMQFVELNIYNIKGQLVKTILQKPTSKNATFVWNGKDSINKSVTSGVYLMEIKANTNDNKYKFHKKALLIK